MTVANVARLPPIDHSSFNPYWYDNLENTILPPTEAAEPKEGIEVVCDCGNRAFYHRERALRIDSTPGDVY